MNTVPYTHINLLYSLIHSSIRPTAHPPASHNYNCKYYHKLQSLPPSSFLLALHSSFSSFPPHLPISPPLVRPRFSLHHTLRQPGQMHILEKKERKKKRYEYSTRTATARQALWRRTDRISRVTVPYFPFTFLYFFYFFF